MDIEFPRPYLEGPAAIHAVQPTIMHGRMEEVLPTLDAESFDACVTDPPYHLTSIVKRFGAANAAPAKSNGPTGVYGRASKGFMGKQWDGGDIAFQPETWAAVLRVLKPGAYLCAFASTRGYHRMVCAIEDAGFTIHPMLAWIFGTGFPKAHRIEAEGWEGWRYGLQSLKPAIEPICLAQKPFSEPTGTANVLLHGTGALNVDACRVGVSRDVPVSLSKCKAPNGIYGDYGGGQEQELDPNIGRWPSNVAHDGSLEVMDAFARFGERHGDTGTAARFFYCAKAGKLERGDFKHPTVKPVALMEWLVRLVTPPNGRVLDLFAGTGSTLVACDRLGFNALGIEQDEQTVADAQEKLRRMGQPRAVVPPPEREAGLSGMSEPETAIVAVRASTAPQSATYLEGPAAIHAVQTILTTPGTAAIDFETYPTSPKWHGDQAARDAPRGQQSLARERAVLEAAMMGRALHRRPCTLQLAHEDGLEVFVRLTDPMHELPAMFDLAPWEDRATLVGHNSAFETEVLLKHGVAVDIECTLLAAKCLYIVAVADDQPQPVGFSLAELVEKEFGHVLDKGVRDRDWREPPDAAAVRYGLEDVRWTLRLWQLYEGRLKSSSR